MKVLAINGSARKDGNTAILIRLVFKELEKAGIKTEMLQLAGENLAGCVACYKCFDNKNRRCAVQNDAMNDIIEKMEAADGIILGTPTYFANVTANLKAVIERAGLVGRANDFMYARKPCAAVVAVRRAGSVQAMNAINDFFLGSDMIVVGSTYWNIGVGREIGQVEADDEGVHTMRRLGENLAWVMGKLG